MKTNHFPRTILTVLSLLVIAFQCVSCYRDVDPSRKPKDEALNGTTWAGPINYPDFGQGEVILTFDSAISGKMTQKIPNTKYPMDISLSFSYAYVSPVDAYKLKYGDEPEECLWARVNWNDKKLYLHTAGPTENNIGKEVVVLTRQK